MKYINLFRYYNVSRNNVLSKKRFIGYSHIQHLVPKFNWFNKNIANAIIASSRISTDNK